MVMLNLENKLSKRFTVTMYVFVITFVISWQSGEIRRLLAMRPRLDSRTGTPSYELTFKRVSNGLFARSLGSIPLRRDQVSFYQTL